MHARVRAFACRAAVEKHPTLTPDKGDEAEPWHDRRWRLEQERLEEAGEAAGAVNDENAGGNGGVLRLEAAPGEGASPKALSPSHVDPAGAHEGLSPGATSPVRKLREGLPHPWPVATRNFFCVSPHTPPPFSYAPRCRGCVLCP